MISRRFLSSITTALFVSAFGAPVDTSDCAVNKDACSCPSDTTFYECTTTAVIGAALEDVQALTGDFFHTEWMGLAPESTNGEDNVLGSTRTLTVPTQKGTYQFTEELITLDRKGDGSYTLMFKQQNVPVRYDKQHGPGSFSGFWVTRSSHYGGPYRTKMVWNVYACLTGTVGFPEFHRLALNNATATLQMLGKIKGVSEPPHSDCQPSGDFMQTSDSFYIYDESAEIHQGLRIQVDFKKQING
ncbi:hypothetical protein BGW36DRAFT_406841 [Talaromyces proteolyticus]|uniref:Uncharacterized protein n=1 Tax=Talaromyces proteolyticus TaxID=1131652 RepID=A0AAD4KTJ7_9EURO|nr:uncharacterized protein BGW36DRAFT_406841 [Talaromyces proteolyticus]KAH8698993.1 hypothetical protein BGW36DRAFT_406841 [Talaromyces proteolyticus]